MSEFNWDDVYARRRKIAVKVQKRLGLSFSLAVGLSFSALPLTDQLLSDKPMWEIPFYVIAQRMIAEGDHVIDHAWWLLADDRSGEPWGFVTEPYIDPANAKRIASLIQLQHETWGIEVNALPKSQSAWNPGSTVPIVVNATSGYLREFLFFGVGAALEALR